MYSTCGIDDVLFCVCGLLPHSLWGWPWRWTFLTTSTPTSLEWGGKQCGKVRSVRTYIRTYASHCIVLTQTVNYNSAVIDRVWIVMLTVHVKFTVLFTYEEHSIALLSWVLRTYIHALYICYCLCLDACFLTPPITYTSPVMCEWSPRQRLALHDTYIPILKCAYVCTYVGTYAIWKCT